MSTGDKTFLISSTLPLAIYFPAPSLPNRRQNKTDQSNPHPAPSATKRPRENAPLTSLLPSNSPLFLLPFPDRRHARPTRHQLPRQHPLLFHAKTPRPDPLFPTPTHGSRAPRRRRTPSPRQPNRLPQRHANHLQIQPAPRKRHARSLPLPAGQHPRRGIPALVHHGEDGAAGPARLSHVWQRTDGPAQRSVRAGRADVQFRGEDLVSAGSAVFLRDGSEAGWLGCVSGAGVGGVACDRGRVGGVSGEGADAGLVDDGGGCWAS